MNSSDQQPKFPSWVFIATDLALIGIAATIAWKANKSLSSVEILTIIGLVGVGVLVGLVPLIVRLEREKNEVLDERQRALEALARTVSASAEQISIAAGGLHEIADIAQKNLKHAEQLPHKLQEKIAEFQAQLTTTEDAQKEELERELLALRTTESERLESTSQRIAKSSAEWAKLEAATHQHLTAANEALAKLAMGTANAIGKAQAAAEQALAQARTEAARSLGETSGQATRAIETAKNAALAELDAKFAAETAAAVQRVAGELSSRLATATLALEEKITRLEAAAKANVGATRESVLAPAPTNETVTEAPAAPATEAPATTPRPLEPAPAITPKRSRKPRREEPAPVEPTATTTAVTPAEPDVVAPAAVEIRAEEPAPVPAEKIAEVAPIAPVTAEPFSDHLVATATDSDQPESGAGAPASTSPEVAPAATSEPAAVAAPRRRAPKKAEPEMDGALDLGLDVPSQVAEPPSEPVLSSDGATRLLITAYIGIGNRLFVRGEGPGLSWSKGVPLQFVSIGKWRWETNDASTPIQFKLYKNDEVECTTLGAQTLDPGHQQEFTATF